MSSLYVYNIGRQIHLQIDNIHIQYIGSKALNKFIKVNNYSDGCISVETEFNINNQLIKEEDYIDLRDAFADYNYDIDKIIKSITEIKIGEPQMEKFSKKELIEQSLMVSDNMALVYTKNTTNDVHIIVVNMKDTNARATISIPNFEVINSNMKDTNARATISIPNFKVINSNMSKTMLTRAIDAVKRNYGQLMEEIKEKSLHA